MELATLQWVDCFNHRRLLEPVGDIPPAKLEASLSTTRRVGRSGLTHTKESPAFLGAVQDYSMRISMVRTGRGDVAKTLMAKDCVPEN